MNTRLEFVGREVNLILGDVFKLTEQMNATGPVVGWQELLTKMPESDIQGAAIGLDGTVTVTA